MLMGTSTDYCDQAHSICFWDIKNRITTYVDVHTGSIRALVLLGDDKIVTCSHDRCICIFDIHTAHCIQTLSGHTDWVRDVAVCA